MMNITLFSTPRYIAPFYFIPWFREKEKKLRLNVTQLQPTQTDSLDKT